MLNFVLGVNGRRPLTHLFVVDTEQFFELHLWPIKIIYHTLIKHLKFKKLKLKEKLKSENGPSVMPHLQDHNVNLTCSETLAHDLPITCEL